ncbi:MAG: formylglycine-generating enzyme family protein [Proteobacteria bacterium]|nr:formylglycine-generating enzyme family protein [Pseudomonadota bacterium]
MARRIENRRPFVMVRIPAGEFVMGSRFGHGDLDELPEHRVWVDEFLIGRHPVTALEWARFLNEAGPPDPAFFEPGAETTVVSARGGHYPRQGCSFHPANGVTWYGAVAFCRWLSDKSGQSFRLPTEAEWEKAARGGLTGQRYPWGNETPEGRAQFHQTWADPKHTLAPVDAYPPNPYGLNDMVGNVWEWCSDYYDRQYYSHSPQSNPSGPESGALRVLRGGAWGLLDIQVRCGIRVGEFPDAADSRVGFRLARSI